MSKRTLSTDDANAWVSRPQAARLLNISVRRLRDLQDDGRLPKKRDREGHFIFRIRWLTEFKQGRDEKFLASLNAVTFSKAFTMLNEGKSNIDVQIALRLAPADILTISDAYKSNLESVRSRTSQKTSGAATKEAERLQAERLDRAHQKEIAKMDRELDAIRRRVHGGGE